ncbi:YbhB/YbcL family Raf kinase inhibitor-like protein [Actinoplanes sp. HUAS TT8]|uniref:YbhB/YbcL family Raf kinase inhibitor-like protein n=1 Tax=Actinoplanes sp. HUAS TT8 TaxID=3447453 RepID=UPI003F5226F4
MHPVEILLFPLGRALRNRRPDESASLANAPGLATPNHFTLSSPAFRDGEVIPAKHCGIFIGSDTSPALTWSELPEGTKDLVLIFEDLDVPLGPKPGIHTIVAFTPNADGLPEGALTPKDPSFRFLPALRGIAKYVGPRPLPGHGPHRYRFHLYALDTPIDLTRIPNPTQLPPALAGHVLASATLTGTRTC